MDKHKIRDLAEQIMKKSFNACLCIQITEKGETCSFQPLYANQAFEQIFQCEAEKLEPIWISDLFRLLGKSQNEHKILEKLLQGIELEAENYYDKLHEKYLLCKMFLLEEFVVGILFLDVTEMEKADRKNRALLKKVEASEEELKYQVNLLTATQNKLMESERIYRMVSHYSNDGFYYKNFKTNKALASSRWYDLFPLKEKKISDLNEIITLLSAEGRSHYCKERGEVLEQKRSSATYTYLMKDGRWVLQTSYYFYNEQSDLMEQICFFQDITKHVQQRMKLEHLAYYDVDSGLFSRNHFTAWLEETVSKARDEFKTVQFIHIDVDHFKRIIDSIGIQLADEIIQKIAAILKTFETSSIKVGRLASDEFGIGILDNTVPDKADRIANVFMEQMKLPFLLSNGVKYFLTVSVGIAEYDSDMKSAADLMRAADLAVYEMKRSGRNGILHFEKAMEEKFVTSVFLEQKLQDAIDKEELFLLYQPQYDLFTNKVRGAEALIRWKNGELGNVNPLKFIPVAEENGMIHQIGEWVIEQALKTLRRWVVEFEYNGIMSVNISAIQFRNMHFMEVLKEITERYHLEPKQIELELTEKVFLDDYQQAKNLLHEVRSYGYRISLDDFGTGYSSLAYLREVPIDTLKIDRSFVANLMTDTNTGIITTSIIEMVRKLGFETIAEGVETKEQLNCLKQIQCMNVQGFLLGKPMPEEELEKTFFKKENSK